MTIDHAPEWDTENAHERFFLLPSGEVVSFFFPIGRTWAIAYDAGSGKKPFMGLFIEFPYLCPGVRVSRWVSNLRELL